MARKQLTSWFIVIKNLKMPQGGYVRAAALLDGEDIHISREQVPGQPEHAHIILDTTAPPSTIRKMLKMGDRNFIELCYDKAESVDYIQKIGKHTAKAYTSIPGSYEHYDFDACAMLRDEIQTERDRKSTESKNRRRRIRAAIKTKKLTLQAIADRENVSLSTVKRIAKSVTKNAEKINALPQGNRGSEVHGSKTPKIIMFPTPAKTTANAGVVRVCAAAPSIAAAMPLYTRVSNNANPAPHSIPTKQADATSIPVANWSTGHPSMPSFGMPQFLPTTTSATSIIRATDGESVHKSMHQHGRRLKNQILPVPGKTAHSTFHAKVA